MPKTENLARLLHLFATGKAFCLVTSLMIFPALLVRAAEPVMTLAMASHQSQSPVAVTPSLAVAPDSSPAASTNNAPVIVRPEKEAAAELAKETRLEKSVGSGQADGLQLVHKNLSASGGSSVAFSVQAGYGRIWDEQSVLSKISAGHQETGCAYLGAKISF
ncbi:MAG TPA: hypothetical protein VNN22_25020 [Verrucomicrobiae bacterium]|nr:hypothetical protein [Verrucomicrobiae bacterium]